MPLSILTPLQRRNLDNLLALRDLCKASQGEAAWTYAIDADAVLFYAKLSDQELLTLSTELDLALFVPRHTVKHLATILAQPPKWHGIYAAVSEPKAHRGKTGDESTEARNMLKQRGTSLCALAVDIFRAFRLPKGSSHA